ncbi:MAG TPA: hypothetical protein VH306_06605 [Gaiellaceae bacterium]|jgi:hypothetical protein
MDEKKPHEQWPTPDAPDPGGTYGTAPGRTGRPPDEGDTDRPADETVPPDPPG